MIGKIILFPLIIIKWSLLSVLGGLIGFGIAKIFASVPVDVLARVFDFIPGLEGLSPHVPSFWFGALGGLIIGKSVFRTEKIIERKMDKIVKK